MNEQNKQEQEKIPSSEKSSEFTKKEFSKSAEEFLKEIEESPFDTHKVGQGFCMSWGLPKKKEPGKNKDEN